MAKAVADAAIDIGPQGVKDLEPSPGLTLYVCTSQPTTQTEAATTFNLATQALDAADLTVQNGATSGRRLTIAQKASISVATSGDAQHIAITDGTTVHLVTTCTLTALSDTGTVTVNTWDWEIADVTP